MFEIIGHNAASHLVALPASRTQLLKKLASPNQTFIRRQLKFQVVSLVKDSFPCVTYGALHEILPRTDTGLTLNSAQITFG
jgi:hypothetical protein